MRLFSKIFSVILVLYILSLLFVPPVKAGCYFNSYYQCTGTCSCICGGSCYCGVNQWGRCVPSGCNTNCCRYNCKHSCNSNEDRVSGSCAGTDMVCCKPRPQPTNTPADVRASPTPRRGGMECSSTTQCYHAYCAPNNIPTPACSSVCRDGHCHTTHPGINPTIKSDVSCQNPNDYGPWSGCLSGQGACGGCAAWGYTCQVRYCINPPNSNQYQISCCCTQPTGGSGAGGSGNPTNTPVPIPNPSSVCDPFLPKKKKFLHLRVFVS